MLKGCYSQWNESSLHARARRRRSFVDFTRGKTSLASTNEKYLEKFTAYALNSRKVPLGTMNDELWDETTKAIGGWMQVGGGIGLDSAGRLLRRLDVEATILHPFNESFRSKSDLVLELYRNLFHSWVDTYSNYRQSKLALLRTGETLQGLIARQASESELFPIDGVLTILDGWLAHDTYDASRNAAKLLLFATDFSTDYHHEMGPYFNVIGAKLADNELPTDGIGDAILQRMELLRDTAGWHTIKLPEFPKLSVVEIPPSERLEGASPEPTSENWKDRVIKAINDAGDDKRATVEALAKKLFEESGQDHRVVKTLIDFYLRIGNIQKSRHWMKAQLEFWEVFDDIEKQQLTEQALRLTFLEGKVTSLVVAVSQRLKEEDRGLSEAFSTKLFEKLSADLANPKLVLKLMSSLESLDDGMDFSLYKKVIQALFKFEKKALVDIQVVYSNVLHKAKKNLPLDTPEAFGDFLYGVVAMYTYRNLFKEADECLLQAEKAFLSKTPKDDKVSVIPLDCYERMIQRKWYTKTTAPPVERTFERMMGFYNSGYSNLRPNQNIFGGYIRARAISASNPGEVEKILDKMIELHERTGDDSCKPNTEIFNSVLGAFSRDSTKIRDAAKSSISLLDKMQRLDIQPDSKSLNYVMQTINKSAQKDVYTKVCEVFDLFDKYHLEPDTFSRHYLLDACGAAGPKDDKAALKKVVETFSTIREANQIGPLTYPILSKVLLQLLPKNDDVAKVVPSAFLLCCKDGFFEQEVKKRFQSLMTKDTWNELYNQKLEKGNGEPQEWTRNIS
eukprot:scaffold22609_cov142-Cylindrotheca_fusiformis.AAC.10